MAAEQQAPAAPGGGGKQRPGQGSEHGSGGGGSADATGQGPAAGRATPAAVGRCGDPDEAIAPLSLRLSPPALEAEFWRAHGGLCASLDRWALPALTANSAASVAAFAGRPGDPSPLRGAAVTAGVALLAAATAATWAWLLAAPASYMRRREGLLVAQRALRTCVMLTFTFNTCSEYWTAFVQRTPRGLEAAGLAGAMATALFSILCVWALQTLLFFLRWRVAAPLHVASCAAGYAAMRPRFCCAVARDARLAEAAGAVCRAAQHAKHALLAAAGAAAGPMAAAKGARPLCDAAGPEAVVALCMALAVAAALYPMYVVERSLKAAFLRARAAERAAAAGTQPEAHAPGGPLCHFFGAVAALMAAFLVAEHAAAWAPPPACPAA